MAVNMGSALACAVILLVLFVLQCTLLGIVKQRALDPQQIPAAAVLGLAYALVIASLVMGPHECLVHGKTDGNCEIDQDDLT